MRSSTGTVLQLTFILWQTSTLVYGFANITVSPFPALIYQGARVGIPVLSVHAVDEDTGKPLQNVALTSNKDSNYFELSQQPKVPTEWILKVKQRIDKPVGYVFSFSVYGYKNQLPNDSRIQINVTEMNEYAPSFETTEYTFTALRNALDYNLTDVGTVHAIDADTELYNKQFHYHILDPHVQGYFQVDHDTGIIEMIENLPYGISNITFSVTAIDGGSPQRLNSTDVIVMITDTRPPDVFCVAVEESVARICWKDPTNGSYVMKYELLFKMDEQNATTVPVRVEGVGDETCSIVTGSQLGRNYTFTVRVLNGLEWSPESLQRKVSIENKGLYGSDCSEFSSCSIWEPCMNQGECLANPDTSYKCNCTNGWRGVNCTEADLCTGDPCYNGGTCVYQGHMNYTCTCPETHYGNVCQYFNCCSSIPCKNAGNCNIDLKYNFTCTCQDGYNKELSDTSEPCSPSPCRHGNCYADGSEFACVCFNGYFGAKCEHEDVCTLYNPCTHGDCTLNNVSNENDSDKYICSCDAGFHGKNCDKFNICEVASLEERELCENNGTCVYDELNSFNCTCHPGFWGANCSNFDPCFDKPCANGRCINVSNENYTCECYSGHFGEHCEHFDPCSENPCHIGSTCTYLSDIDYNCMCAVERFGKNCEKINGCNIRFCHNNASCVNTTDYGEIKCLCAPGLTGELCDIPLQCNPSPCLNGATCTFVLNKFHCACPFGFRGKMCEHIDPCVNNPCWNDGKCSVDETDETIYQCECSPQFYGTHCENYRFCQFGYDCPNESTCTVKEGLEPYNMTVSEDSNSTKQVQISNSPACVCIYGYSGDRCENVSPCVRFPCGDGKCEVEGEGHICHCPDGTDRVHCNEVYCEEDHSFYDKTGWYIWPRTKSGNNSTVQCNHAVGGMAIEAFATRYCHVNKYGVAFWENPDTAECNELQETEVSESLRLLESLTRDASGLKSEEIANITSTLEQYFFFSFENIEIAKEMTMVVGNLLDANESVMIESNSRNQSSDRLLWLLDEYSKRVNTTDEIVIETENINLHVVNHTSGNTGFIYEPHLEENDIRQQGGIRLTLPAEALTSSNAQEFPRIRFMTFRSSSFFIPEDAPPQEIVIKQWVVTAVVQDRKIENLTTPVEINVQNIKNGANHSCAYWDVENETWSSDGIYTVERGPNYTICHSYHLTSFAILLDPSPDHALSDKHENILTFISYIGCGISMLGLILTLITYSIFPCLNREKSGKILMNLCVSMLLMNAIFFLGSESSLSVSGDAMCKAVAILLHYFLLTTLAWMLVEAINMYQALITVFTKYSGFFMLKRCLIAWGVPALVVIATVAVDVDNYKTSTDLCFLSQGHPLAFYIALLGPACLVLLVNIAVFIMVSRVILRPRFHGQVGKNQSDSITPTQIRGAFTVMTLLGVTWVFGPFAINEAKVAVNYVFTILNSLQGFLIFVFRCCFNPEVRLAWLVLIKTGKFKRRKGPVTAYTSDSTSSKSESKLNGTSSDTLKSNVYNSLGKQRNVLNNDKNVLSKNTNMQMKTPKDGYFDDLHTHRARDDRRNSGENTKLYARNYENYDRNCYHNNKNEALRRYSGNGNQNTITTIYNGQYNGQYPGQYNGIKRHSGHVSHQDEFTRL